MAGISIVVIATIWMMMVGVQGQQCTYQDGVGYKQPGNSWKEGELVTLFNLASASACCSACSGFAECKYFSYSKTAQGTENYQKCVLYTDVVITTADSNSVGGTSSRTPPNRLSYPCSATISGTDYDNGFLGKTLYNVADSGTCCTACKNYTGCNYYGYAAGNKACYLKQSNANPSPNSGVVSGSIVQQRNVPIRTGKRGLGIFDTTSCSDLQLLPPSVSWIYNWAAQLPGNLKQCAMDLGIEYVPMQWGLPLALSNIDTSAKWLLGFNEPNFGSQSNLTPEQAAAKWPEVQAFAKQNGMKLVSPSASAGGSSDAIAWFDKFFANCPGCLDGLDAIATHIYSCYPGGVKTYTDGMKKYNKPIWLTEFNCADWEYSTVKCSSFDYTVNYVNTTLNLMEADAQYDRYAIFGTRGGVGPYSNVYDASSCALSPVGVTYVNHVSASTSSSSATAGSTVSASAAASTVTGSGTNPTTTTAGAATATATVTATAATTKSVVSIYPKYLGCFIDGKTGRDLPNAAITNKSLVMTVPLCLSACKTMSKAYAGLQYASECFCGNAYGRQGGQVADSECNMKCKGNSTQFCGAGNRNSIYQVMDVSSAVADESLENSSSPIVSPLCVLSFLFMIFACLFV